MRGQYFLFVKCNFSDIAVGLSAKTGKLSIMPATCVYMKRATARISPAFSSCLPVSRLTAVPGPLREGSQATSCVPANPKHYKFNSFLHMVHKD